MKLKILKATYFVQQEDVTHNRENTDRAIDVCNAHENSWKDM